MAVKKEIIKKDKLTLWLFVGALVIEIINTIISIKLGAKATNVCPKPTGQQWISIFMSIISALLIVISIAKSKISLVRLYGLFAIILLACWAFALWLFTLGGLSFCSYHF